jgi:molybdopterin-guanine dinucleotide biosynthesis protein A
VPARPFDAVVLAGGRAVRAGGIDKPGQLVGGRSLVAAVTAAAFGAGAARVIVAGPPRDGLGAALARAAVVFVREDPPGSGPVAALRAGMAEVSAPLVVLLAGDLPFLTPRQLTPLLAAAGDDRAGAVLLDDTGREQWLASCWRSAVLAGALAGYQGYSLHGLLKPLAPVLLPCPTEPGAPPPWLDCDTAGELALARRLAGEREADDTEG